ncbi:MAG: peptidylprolyl isomerase [Pseudomonadota bacterium]
MTFHPLRHAIGLAALVALGLASVPARAQTETTTETDTGSEATPETAAEPAAEPAPETVEVTPQQVLATVNGEDLTLGDLISLRSDLPQEYQQLPDEILTQGLLDQMIDQTLLAQAAKQENFDERLAIALSIRNQIRAVLANAWLRNKLGERVSEEAMRGVYDERIAEMAPEQEIRAAHILVESEERATEIKAELDGGGDFAELAREHGTDGTASRGGDLGWFVKTDMVPQFADAAFALEPGTVSDPVQSPFGWHLIRVDGSRDRAVPSFEEMLPGLAEEMGQRAQVEILEELRSAATIERSEDPLPPAAIRADELIQEE